MPDALVLPGIDAAPPQGADNPTQSATVEPAVEPQEVPTAPPTIDTPAEPSAPEPPAKPPETDAQREVKRQSRGIQRRFDEMTAESRATKEMLARSLAIIERFAGGNTGQQPNVPTAEQDPEPNEGNFSSWQEYQRALNRWDGRQEARRIISERESSAQVAQQHHIAQQQAAQVEQAVEGMKHYVGTQMQAAAARYPDYHEVIESSTVDIPPALIYTIATSEAPGDVAYYLAKNQNVIAQLARLSPVVAAHNIAKIAAHMRSGPSVSNAPAPGRPGGSRGAAVNAYPENATPEQHKAWVEKNSGRAAAR